MLAFPAASVTPPGAAGNETRWARIVPTRLSVKAAFQRASPPRGSRFASPGR